MMLVVSNIVIPLMLFIQMALISYVFICFAEANGSGSSDAEETLAAIQTHRIYSQRTLSDSFHKFAEGCMERYVYFKRKTNCQRFNIILIAFYFRFPEERPDCSQLLSHVLFKQCKHTSLAEQFSTTRMDEFDCTKMTSGNFFLI